LGDNGEYFLHSTRLIFQNLVPSRKTNPVKSGGAEDQICPIFVEAEIF
jgi:hypothetical protein